MIPSIDQQSLSYWLVLFPLLGLVICFVTSPETPYWRVSQGQMRQAYMTLKQRRASAAQASRDLYRMHSKHFKTRRIAQGLAVTALLLVSATAAEVAGIVIMLSMVSMVQDHLSALAQAALIAPFLCSFMLCMLLPTTNLVEKLGRRRLVLISMGIMAFTLFGTMLLPEFTFVPLIIAPITVVLPFAVLHMLSQLYTAKVSCSTGCGNISPLHVSLTK